MSPPVSSVETSPRGVSRTMILHRLVFDPDEPAKVSMSTVTRPMRLATRPSRKRSLDRMELRKSSGIENRRFRSSRRIPSPEGWGDGAFIRGRAWNAKFAAQDRDAFGRRYSKPNAIWAHVQHGQHDIVADPHFFACLSSENEHRSTPGGKSRIRLLLSFS
jgi:hypothetical protein